MRTCDATVLSGRVYFRVVICCKEAVGNKFPMARPASSASPRAMAAVCLRPKLMGCGEGACCSGTPSSFPFANAAVVMVLRYNECPVLLLLLLSSLSNQGSFVQRRAHTICSNVQSIKFGNASSADDGSVLCNPSTGEWSTVKVDGTMGGSRGSLVVAEGELSAEQVFEGWSLEEFSLLLFSHVWNSPMAVIGDTVG